MFSDDDVIIFDMEVTKFSFDNNVLVQFAARKYHVNEMVDKLDILIDNPEILLDHSFTKRTRITRNLLQSQGVSYREAIKEINDFIQNETLITYKGNYYYLKMLYYILGHKLPNPTIDIIDIGTRRRLIGKPDNMSLADYAISLDIDFDHNRWHNASYDVSIIEKIWFKLKAMSMK